MCTASLILKLLNLENSLRCFVNSMPPVLYPYLNLHMKSLGLSITEVAIINAVIPILFIFTPPLAGFMAEKVGNFRILLAILTALGGFFALLLLLIPPSRDVSLYPDQVDASLVFRAIH